MPVANDMQQPAAQIAQVVVISEDWAAADRRPAPAPKATKPAPMVDKRIEAAVAATLAESPNKDEAAPNRQEALRAITVGKSDQQKAFETTFAYAKVPYCLGDNGLKFLPPKIGPIGVTGLLAIPWLVAAKLRGKCK